jgi:hypothetical protein
MTGQQSGKQPERIVVCCYCRKRIFRVKNGEWYHVRNSSTSCNPQAGSDRRATPVEIEENQ